MTTTAGQAGTDRPASNKDEQTVRQVIDAYADRMRAGEVAGILELYTEDAAVMGPDLPTAVGRQQLHEVYTSALGAVAMDFTFTFDQIVVRGDTAVARTHANGKNTVRASGDEVPGRYRELFVLNRQGGNWKIAQYMFQPQPEPEA
jgi:uncharacterized protein (TIGR02246 family)